MFGGEQESEIIFLLSFESLILFIMKLPFEKLLLFTFDLKWTEFFSLSLLVIGLCSEVTETIFLGSELTLLLLLL